MKTLPSELAQDLATWIKQNIDRCTDFEGYLYTNALSEIIQEYWDSLDEHN